MMLGGTRRDGLALVKELVDLEGVVVAEGDFWGLV